MLRVILIVPLLMVALSHASYAKEPCEREDSTVALNECSKFGFDEADRELNLEYQQVLKDLRTLAKAGDDVSKMKAALVKAQRAWVAFRDADCDAVYENYAGGSVRNAVYFHCMEKHIRQRTAALRNLIGP